jgi:glutaminase
LSFVLLADGIIGLCLTNFRGEVELVKQIIATSVPVIVSMSDYDGRTPLHLAASEGHMEVVKLLLEKGAPVNAKDRWGGTPLEDAERGRHEEIKQILISNGGSRTEFRGGVQ